MLDMLEFQKLEPNEDGNFFLEDRVCDEEDLKRIWRLTTESARWMWGKVVENDSLIGPNHWVYGVGRELGPSTKYYESRSDGAHLDGTYGWELEWRADVNEFLAKTVLLAPHEQVFYIFNCDCIWKTEWEIFLKSWSDFRPGHEPGVLISLESDSYAAFTTYGQVWVGKRPAIVW